MPTGLRRANKLDLSRASLDAASVAYPPPPPRGDLHRANPTDHGKLGGKRHLITDRSGVPLGVCATGAKWHDSVALEAWGDALPPIVGKPGR
ncbi:hypothetical protein [Xanthomonas theicola]|uniref:hypothetical protein n=1 Tax=Xanthomonas theicola TaxID=56464 RepID=UPI0016399916|nr:hypothetical protein G4Q83_20585 [Xanthomonas theicola]